VGQHTLGVPLPGKTGNSDGGVKQKSVNNVWFEVIQLPLHPTAQRRKVADAPARASLVRYRVDERYERGVVLFDEGVQDKLFPPSLVSLTGYRRQKFLCAGSVAPRADDVRYPRTQVFASFAFPRATLTALFRPALPPAVETRGM
jgi:hypothetical protein